MNNWLKFETNIPAEQQIRTEKWLLLSFAIIVTIRVLWEMIGNGLHLFESEISSLVFQLFLFGLYGGIVAGVYKIIYPTWPSQSSLVLIIGWTLCPVIALIADKFVENPSLPFMIAKIFTALFPGLAMNWTKPTVRQISILFIAWALAWSGGHWLGIFLGSIFTGYTWAFADAFSILLGILFTLGIQTIGFGKILGMALWGALGFALGNYINGLPIWNSVTLPGEFYYVLWGLVGGAMLEAPSRDWRRILFSSMICGLGLLLSGYVANRILPAIFDESYVSSFPGRLAVFRQIGNGIALGLAIGLLIRHGSAIWMLVLLGIGMFIMTIALNTDVFSSLSDIWRGAIRGALIGLVLGYGYAYMRGATPSTTNIESKE